MSGYRLQLKLLNELQLRQKASFFEHRLADVIIVVWTGEGEAVGKHATRHAPVLFLIARVISANELFLRVMPSGSALDMFCSARKMVEPMRPAVLSKARVPALSWTFRF